MAKATIDQQFVEYVIKSLVDHPDDVQITRTVDSQGIFIQLKVHPEDLGRVIGKGGTTATSIRRLLYALGSKNREIYKFKILDENEQPNLDGPQPREPFVAPVAASVPAKTEEPVKEEDKPEEVIEEPAKPTKKAPKTSEKMEQVKQVVQEEDKEQGTGNKPARPLAGEQKEEEKTEPEVEEPKVEEPEPMADDGLGDTAVYEKTENLTDKTLKELKDLDDLEL